MAGKIRVAHVIPRYFPIFGGAESQCRLLVRHLLATGEVEVPFLVTGRVERQNARMELIDSVAIHRLGITGVGRWEWYWFYLLSSWFLVRHRSAFDVIHCHATSTLGLTMTITGRLLRKPVVLKLSSNGELLLGTGPMESRSRRYLLRSRLRKLLARYLARHSTIVALNREGAKEVETVFPGRSITIPNGIDLKQYAPLGTDSRGVLRTTYGFGVNDVVLLFVGRFVRSKGIHVLLQGFERLLKNPQCGRVHLCLAGGGKLQENDVEGIIQAQAAGSGQRVHVLPPKIPAVEYYQMADIFVFPSQREGLPNAVLEALAVGLPCVLSDIEPHLELKETNPGADVRLFKRDDVEQLTNVIQEALDSLESSEERCSTPPGLAKVYRIEHVAREYVSLYCRRIGANR